MEQKPPSSSSNNGASYPSLELLNTYTADDDKIIKERMEGMFRTYGVHQTVNKQLGFAPIGTCTSYSMPMPRQICGKRRRGI